MTPLADVLAELDTLYARRGHELRTLTPEQSAVVRRGRGLNPPAGWDLLVRLINTRLPAGGPWGRESLINAHTRTEAARTKKP